MFRIRKEKLNGVALGIGELRSNAGDLIERWKLQRDRIASGALVGDRVGEFGAIIQRNVCLLVRRIRDGPGTGPAPCVFEPQRGRQHPIGKAGITDADPLELGIEHRAAVVHAGHPDVDRDAEIGDPREQIGRLRTCRTCGARARQARPLGVRIEPNHRVGALVLQHVICMLHAPRTELSIELDRRQPGELAVVIEQT